MSRCPTSMSQIQNMPEPSWFVRQGIKGLFKAMGASSTTASTAGYTASTLTSLLVHFNHHTHFVPDADHVTDVASSLGDTVDVIDHAQSLHDHVVAFHLHFGSADTGTYDPSSSTATFPDGTVVTNPYQDASRQIYKTTDNWVNGSNPSTVEKT